MQKGGIYVTFEGVCAVLKDAGIEDYRFEARVLLEEYCGFVSSERDYDCPELAAALEKRTQHYPLQYILGKWEFYGLEFKVNENCLIPRADTETVIETARKLLPRGARICDLCAGSGCIGITLLKLYPDAVCDAFELYPKTLDIARENAILVGVSDRYNPICADVLAGGCVSGKYDAIISNPPYIRKDVLKSLSDEVKKEPVAALDGGEDGLVFYRAILDLYADNLCDGGVFIFEIGYDQAAELEFLAAEWGMDCKIIKDLGGRDRVAVIARRVMA